jgi:hypothetical protein
MGVVAPAPPEADKATKDANAAKGGTRTRRHSFTMSILEGSRVESNPELMGLRPTPKVQAKIDAILANEIVPGVAKCHLMPDPKSRFYQMCKEFPLHITLTVMDCIIPCLVGCIPILIAGMELRALKKELPWYIGKLTNMQYDTLHLVSSDLYSYNLMKAFIGRTGYYILAIALVCVMWSPKRMFKPMLGPALTGFVLHVGVSYIDRISRRTDHCFKIPALFGIQAAILYGTCVSSGYIAQRITKMKGFGWMYAVIAFLLIFYMIVCRLCTAPTLMRGWTLTRVPRAPCGDR